MYIILSLSLKVNCNILEQANILSDWLKKTGKDTLSS